MSREIDYGFNFRQLVFWMFVIVAIPFILVALAHGCKALAEKVSDQKNSAPRINRSVAFLFI